MQQDDLALLTVDDVAHQLRVQRSWVYQAAESGRLPALRIGKYLRFERAAINAWLAERKRNDG